MDSAYSQPSSDQTRESVGRRSAALIFVIAVHALLLLMLLTLAAMPTPKPEAAPAAIDFIPLPPPAAEPTPAATPAKSKRPAGGASPRKQAPRVVPAKSATPNAQSSSAVWANVLSLTKNELDAADISKMPSRSADRDGGGGTGGSGAGKGTGMADGNSDGPGGAPLYDADWYRRPTDAELNGYLHSPPPKGSWALIACKMVADYRVEDCRALDQSPLGSGLANEMVKAAWQFRVMPPRIGSRKLTGVWVRIRISWTEGDAG